MRRAGPSDTGTRKPTERLSTPHCTLIGASEKGRSRRKEFTLGASIGMTWGRKRCRPATWERNNAVSRPSVSANKLRRLSISSTDWWICMELPGWLASGLAMNVA